MEATATQQPDVTTLCNEVLHRNRQRNNHATTTPSEIPLVARVVASVAQGFDPLHWRKVIENLAADFSSRDPRGNCWQFIKANHPALWADHVKAELAVDAAHQEQNEQKIMAAISAARKSFNAMLEAWEKRHQFIQQPLVG